METWYIEDMPVLNGGNEDNEWFTYAFDAFDEALDETILGDNVKFCAGQFNGETGLFDIEVEAKAVVQDRAPDAYTRGWQRQILTRIRDNLSQYKYIKFKDSPIAKEQIYLIETMPSSNHLYTKAVIHECNYTLKWQDESGEIYYYPSYTADATQYNTGVENASTVVRTGYVQLMSWISLDDVTVELQRDKRMFIDYSKKHPDTYVITSMSKVPYSYNEMRMMRITFTECEYNPDTDRIDLMLCDYIEPAPISDIKYSGEPNIRIGSKKTFTVDNENPTFEIVATPDVLSKITLTQTGGKCVIKCDNDESVIGSTIKLKAAYSGVTKELLITIKGVV